mgnify:CR=1 FL=1
MTNRRQPWTIGWLVALVVVSALTSAWIAVRRHRVEAMNRRVELCMDWREGALYAQRIGLAEDDYLAQLRDAGITSIALDEDTLGSLQASGDLVIFRTSELAAVSSLAPGLLPAAVNSHAVSGGRTVVIPLNHDTDSFLADRLPTRLLDIGAQSLEPLGHWHCRRVGRRLQVPHCGRMLRQGGRIRHLSDLLQGGLDLGKCPFDLGEVQTGAALRVGCITALIDSSNPVLVGQFHT